MTAASIRQNWPVMVLAVLAIAAALRIAQDIMAPLFLAFVTALVLTPVMNGLRRLHLPSPVAAMLTLIVALATLAAIAFALRPWVSEVIEALPRVGQELRAAAIDIRFNLSTLFDMEREMMEAIAPESSEGSSEGGGTALPSLVDAAWLAPRVGAQVLIFFGGLFFFLLGKENAYEWATAAGLRPDDFRRAEARVSTYFAAVTVINIVLGITVALALSAYGLPGAPVWGIVVGLANYVIYLGPAVTAVALLLAGTVAFDGIAAVLPMLIYLGINLMEAQFVTPLVIGSRMRLDPLLVFLSLAVWLWLWGPIGGIVAIPLVLWAQSLWNDAQLNAQVEGKLILEKPPVR